MNAIETAGRAIPAPQSWLAAWRDAARELPAPLRATLVLAVAGQLLVVLASFGILTTAAMFLIAIPAALAIAASRPVPLWLLAALIPMAVLASYPPHAFDETLYHLPYIRSIVRTGSIVLRDDIRFGTFPMLQELLCVPVFVAFGATATHFVSLLELALLGALLLRWPSRPAAWLAAAIVLGNPAMLGVSGVAYVDAALVLFIAAGFFCLWRGSEPDSLDPVLSARQALLGGFFLGTATSVKYLGWLFIAAGVLYAARRLPHYLAGVFAGATPMVVKLVLLTGNPVHPYFGNSEWTASYGAPGTLAMHAARFGRLLYDITFERARAGMQPPYTPLFALALFTVVFVGKRWRIGALCLAYFAAYVLVMAADSRYLLTLVPLVSVAAAEIVAARVSRRTMAVIALVAASPLMLYPCYTIARRGVPPVSEVDRQAFVERRVPGLRALRRVGPGRIYGCGTEHLKDFGGDRFRGDYYGRYAYDKVFAGGLATLDAQWFLVASPQCPAEWQQQIASVSRKIETIDGVTIYRRRTSVSAH